MSLDSVLDWAIGLVGAVVAWLAHQWAKMRGDIRVNEKELAEQDKRQAVLEAKFDAIPQTLTEIKNEITGFRADMKTELRGIHGRIDSKADKA